MNAAAIATLDADLRPRLLTQISHNEADADSLKQLVDRDGLEALFQWATSQKVERIAATVLAGQRLMPATHEHATSLANRNAEIATVLEWLCGIFSRLSSAGVSLLVSESAGATLASGGELTRFCSSDIDLLVREPEPGIVNALLTEAGCRHAESLPSVHRRVFTLPKSLGVATIRSLEVATVPFARKWTAIDHGPIDWFPLGQPDSRYPEIRRLPATEAFVFQSVHASLHYYRLSPGLRLIAELQWLLEHPEFSWSAMRKVCDSGRFVRRVACALQCVAEVFELGGHQASYASFMNGQHMGAKLALRVLAGSRHRSGLALRGALEPLLDDRGTSAWLADLARFQLR